jgi:hypothetical protein
MEQRGGEKSEVTSQAKEQNIRRRWTPLDIRKYLEGREGEVWRRQDTQCLLDRMDEIDELTREALLAAGVEIVEWIEAPVPGKTGLENRTRGADRKPQT